MPAMGHFVGQSMKWVLIQVQPYRRLGGALPWRGRRPWSRRRRPGRSRCHWPSATACVGLGEAGDRRRPGPKTSRRTISSSCRCAGNHGGLVEEALVGAMLAAGGDLHMLRSRRRARRSWRRGRAGAWRSAGRSRSRVSSAWLNLIVETAAARSATKLVVDLVARHRCGRRRCSPGRHCSSRRRGWRSTAASISASVVDDDRGLAAELEMRALDRLGGCLSCTFLPVAISPVIDSIWIFGLLISALPTLSPRPSTTLTTPSGRISAMNLGELQRRQRRLLGGLEDHGVAAGERRCQLPGHHHQRVVPRRNRADDADRHRGGSLR